MHPHITFQYAVIKSVLYRINGSAELCLRWTLWLRLEMNVSRKEGKDTISPSLIFWDQSSHTIQICQVCQEILPACTWLFGDKAQKGCFYWVWGSSWRVREDGTERLTEQNGPLFSQFYFIIVASSNKDNKSQLTMLLFPNVHLFTITANSLLSNHTPFF